MRKSFRYRLYPTRQQERAMLTMLDTHRHLYNRALAERRNAWEQAQRSVRYGDQSAQLKLSRRLVNECGTIGCEDLRITRMIKNHVLAKSMADASWNQLISDTQYKAEGAGSVCLQMDPRGTSHRCSAGGVVAGALRAKDLSIRVHQCPSCGLEINRDLNAALNILAVGLHGIGTHSVEAAPL